MYFLAQIANAPQLPPLPEGPAIESVRGPLEITQVEFGPIALMVVTGLLLLGLLYWLFFRRNQKDTVEANPYKNAMDELDAATRLTEADDERFAVLSSLALRRYLEDACGLRFRARTSEEFLQSLRAEAVFDSDFQSQLTEVLAAFDHIKFAGGRIGREKRKALSHSVGALIQIAEAKFAKGGSES